MTATPGQAAHRRWQEAAAVLGVTTDDWDELEQWDREAWEAAQEPHAAPELAEQLRLVQADLADAEAEIGRWPRCPSGCRCRVGTSDADALECGCDGPCTTGWEPKPAPELAAAMRDAHERQRLELLQAQGEAAETAAELSRIKARHAAVLGKFTSNGSGYTARMSGTVLARCYADANLPVRDDLSHLAGQ